MAYYDEEQGVSDGIYVGNELFMISDDEAEEIHISLNDFTQNFNEYDLLQLQKDLKDLAGEIEILISSRLC